MRQYPPGNVIWDGSISLNTFDHIDFLMFRIEDMTRVQDIV